MSGLQILDIYKSFGGTKALAGVTFDIAQSEVMAVLGPSGCGKSTLLSIIAGLETADRGQVLWDGIPLTEVPPYRRGFGLMFQDFALFPHRNVVENVAFGLEMAHLSASEIKKRENEVLELVGLPGFEKRDVNTLSGGEQQRVALARSLAPNPRLLMLDEPLGALDRNLRERLVLDLKEILNKSQQTALYVTHDQEEAFTLADRVVVMNKGRVEQIGAPQEIYRHPATVFVARFLGLNNLLPGEVSLDHGIHKVTTLLGEWPVMDAAPVGQATVLLRPDAAKLDGNGLCRLQGAVAEASFRGSTCRAVIIAQGIPLVFIFPSSANLPPVGNAVELSFNPEEAVQILSPQSLQ